MVDIESGYYAEDTRERVTVWPAPDKDGDGPQVWETRYDTMGNPLGRAAVKDKDGNDVFEYSPPDGFLEQRTQQPGNNDPGVAYVRADERGRVWRHPVTGEAAGISPGTVLVEKANGDFHLLTDEYSVYLYKKSRVKADDQDDVEPVKGANSAEDDARDQEEQDRLDFEEWKANRDKEPVL